VAVLTTEPLDIANIVDVPADLSTPFDDLTNSDTDADNALTFAAPVGGHGTATTPRAPSTGAPGPALLAASVRDG
jgi:hypothetical protein